MFYTFHLQKWYCYIVDKNLHLFEINEKYSFSRSLMHACMCAYVCMYVCMYVCLHVCMYICMYLLLANQKHQLYITESKLCRWINSVYKALYPLFFFIVRHHVEIINVNNLSNNIPSTCYWKIGKTSVITEYMLCHQINQVYKGLLFILVAG